MCFKIFKKNYNAIYKISFTFVNMITNYDIIMIVDIDFIIPYNNNILKYSIKYHVDFLVLLILKLLQLNMK